MNFSLNKYNEIVILKILSQIIDYQNDSKVSEIVLKNDSTTSDADDENIHDSTTDDEVFYDPEPFMGCPCGKKYFSDIPYKRHMAKFHPGT